MTARGEDILAWLDNAITKTEADADRWHDAECSFHETTLIDVTVLQGGATLCDCEGPASVRRFCAADRKLLELHQPMDNEAEMAVFCTECDVSGNYPYFPCTTLRIRAEAYGWTEGER